MHQLQLRRLEPAHNTQIEPVASSAHTLGGHSQLTTRRAHPQPALHVHIAVIACSWHTDCARNQLRTCIAQSKPAHGTHNVPTASYIILKFNTPNIVKSEPAHGTDIAPTASSTHAQRRCIRLSSHKSRTKPAPRMHSAVIASSRHT